MTSHPNAVLEVIDQCALKPDLSLFDAGDQTEVGEKGITLRCVYTPLSPKLSLTLRIKRRTKGEACRRISSALMLTSSSRLGLRSLAQCTLLQ